MASLIAAYLAAGIAIGAYLSWLGLRNRNLARQLDALEKLQSDRDSGQFESRAA
jgi:CcmD family protein